MAARIAAATIAAACSVGASAATCYQVLDKNDTIIYRDRTPPWDLSTGDAGSRLKAPPPGERLMFFEADLCAPAALGRYAHASSDDSGGFFVGVREMGIGKRPGSTGVKNDQMTTPAASAAATQPGKRAAAPAPAAPQQ